MHVDGPIQISDCSLYLVPPPELVVLAYRLFFRVLVPIRVFDSMDCPHFYLLHPCVIPTYDLVWILGFLASLLCALDCIPNCVLVARLFDICCFWNCGRKVYIHKIRKKVQGQRGHIRPASCAPASQPVNFFLRHSIQTKQEVIDLGIASIDTIMGSILAAYLDFLGKGDNVAFIQLHDPVHIYLGVRVGVGG